MVLYLELMNESDSTWDALRDDDYKVLGLVDEREVTFASHWDASFNMYYHLKYQQNFLHDDVPPGMPWNTVVAFDVNPQGTEWQFIFTPEDIWDDRGCEVRIPLE